MNIEAFFDARTWTLSYLVWDENTRDAVIIDPVLDYDPLRVNVFEESIGLYTKRIEELGLKLHWSLETHAHADHISGSARLREQFGAKVAIGKTITAVQSLFAGVFGRSDLDTSGGQFDKLVDDGEELVAGSLKLRAITTPGHTPACVTWQIGDAIFTGDAIFMPDYGTGRCDFPKGSADDLYASIQKLYALPDSTRVFVGHDYQPDGRKVEWESTIGEEKAKNIQLKAETSREEFVTFRKARDAKLAPPNLIFQSIQCNIDAGNLPPADAAGHRRLILPMGVFK